MNPFSKASPRVQKAATVTRWSRPRLVVSWGVLLLAYLAWPQETASFVPLILLCLAGWIRPAPLKLPQSYPGLDGAVAVLFAVPFAVAALSAMRSGPVMAFMQSASGRALIVGFWLTGVVADFRRHYRALEWPAPGEAS